MSKDKFVSGDNETTILLTSSMSKQLTRAKYLTFGTRKAFNYLQYIFTQTPIL